MSKLKIVGQLFLVFQLFSFKVYYIRLDAHINGEDSSYFLSNVVYCAHAKEGNKEVTKKGHALHISMRKIKY